MEHEMTRKYLGESVVNEAKATGELKEAAKRISKHLEDIAVLWSKINTQYVAYEELNDIQPDNMEKIIPMALGELKSLTMDVSKDWKKV